MSLWRHQSFVVVICHVSSTLGYFLMVRVLLLPIVCPCVSQSLLLRNTHPSSLSQLTIISKLSPHHPVPYSLYPPINRHCTNHCIADPQTKIHAYSTTKKQYTTNIIIIIIPLFYTSQSRHTNPYLCIMYIAKHTSLVTSNTYRTLTLISVHYTKYNSSLFVCAKVEARGGVTQ